MTTLLTNKCVRLIWCLALAWLMATTQPLWADDEGPDFAKTVETDRAFWDLVYPSGIQASRERGLVYWLKFFYLPGSEGGEIIFQNSRRYALHHDFAERHLEQFQGMDAERFLERTRRADGRLAFVGTVFVDQEKAGVQILSDDPLEAEDVARIVTKLRQAMPMLAGAQPLHLVPAVGQGDNFERLAPELGPLGVVVQSFSSVFSTTRDECYSTGWAAGRLVQAKAATIWQDYLNGTIAPSDIVIVDEVLAEMPPVAGLITETIATPSSHTALLFEQKSKPMVHVVAADELARLKGLAGALAFLMVEKDGGCGYRVVIERDGLDRTWVEFLNEQRQVVIEALPAQDLSVRTVAKLGSFGREASAVYGAKAANLSELTRILKDSSAQAPGVALPFWFFHQMLDASRGQTTLRTEIENILAHQQPPYDRLVLSEKLREIREKILAADIPPAVQQEITAQLAPHFERNAMLFLRSSTNAEDIDEFNGAGLYESVAGCLADKEGDATQSSQCVASSRPKPFTTALKRVWASLFNDAAFAEWADLGLVWRDVAMAVLINPYEQLSANGVIQTGPDGSIEFISQPGAEEVTNPTPRMRAEIRHTHPRYSAGEPTLAPVQQFSGLLPEGQSVLRDDEYLKLAQRIDRVREAYRAHTDLGLDFEWIRTARGDLWLTQVRPIPEALRKSGFASLSPVVLAAKNVSLEPCGVYGYANYSALRLLRSRAAWEADYPTRLFSEQQLEQPVISRGRLRIGTGDDRVFAFDEPLMGGAWEKKDESNYRDSSSGHDWRITTWQLSTPLATSDGARYTLLEERKVWRDKNTGLVRDPFLFVAGERLQEAVGDTHLTLEVEHRTGLERKDEASGEVPLLERRDRLELCSAEPGLSRKEVFERRVGTEFKEATGSFRGETISFAIDYLTNYKLDVGFAETYVNEPLKVTVSGVASSPIVLESRWSMAYATSRHNYAESLAFDFIKEPGLDAALRRELEAKNVRWLYLERRGSLGRPCINEWAAQLIGRDGKILREETIVAEEFAEPFCAYFTRRPNRG